MSLEKVLGKKSFDKLEASIELALTKTEGFRDEAENFADLARRGIRLVGVVANLTSFPANPEDGDAVFVESETQVYFFDAGSSTWKNSQIVGSAIWGNVQGTLSDQTDLQTALDGKKDRANEAVAFSSANIPVDNQIRFRFVKSHFQRPFNVRVDFHQFRTVSESAQGSGLVQATMDHGLNDGTIRYEHRHLDLYNNVTAGREVIFEGTRTQDDDFFLDVIIPHSGGASDATRNYFRVQAIAGGGQEFTYVETVVEPIP